MKRMRYSFFKNKK